MDIGIKIDTSSALNALDKLQARIPRAERVAVNNVAWKARRTVIDRMKTAYDRPTRWTLGSPKVVQAKPNKTPVVAEVGIRDWYPKSNAGAKYLAPTIFGIRRLQKKHERILPRLKSGKWVPGKETSLDPYGNIPGKDITRMLSNTRTAFDPNQYTKSGTYTKYFLKRGKHGGMMVMERYGDKRARQRPVYTKSGRISKAKKNRTVKYERDARPFIVEVREPRYRVMLPLEKIVRKVHERYTKQELEFQVNREIKRTFGVTTQEVSSIS